VTRGVAEKRVEILSTLIEEASALALAGAGAHGVQVHFRFDPNAAKVLADRIQVQQVLINLMRNGLEAMAGMRLRELEVMTTLLDPGTIEIAVSDRGSGLPSEIAERLFEPFVSTKHDGMGLGLVICRSIVEAHGGRLWSGPNPGGGTIFRFTLEPSLAIRERHVG
jgi:two-component system sensor kinase FixL